MKCPVCRATYRPNETSFCQRCKTDLSSLIQIHDRAVWHYRQALQLFTTGDYLAAQAHNDRAIALHSHHADFHAFAGQLRALQGDVQQAIVAWEQAQQLEPLHPVASKCLQILTEIGSREQGRAGSRGV
ncbi:tetratricopeptide repeat protein [Scytonema millei]|uniref:Tetratricopeptide repeat protein n=1 Tax=Scytonema millei VB511283 TaxID=1245923 RepID=A0A9X5E5Y5_9CYAN|nr:tetratricopeptide repeat protein [Scytonema millei]NHC35920.1 tetratricopeptide repeat protein [Scytonema millei VB511283]